MKAAIGISFGEGNHFNQQIRCSSLLSKNCFYMTDNFQLYCEPVSKVLHMAALRYVLTTCRYLGIRKVAVATENFSIKDQIEYVESFPPVSRQRKYGPRASAMQTLLTQPSSKKSYWVSTYTGVFEFMQSSPGVMSELSLYQMLHLLNLMEDVDLQLVQTGRIDQKVLANLAFRNIRNSSFDFDADFEGEGTDSGEFMSRILSQLQKNEITVTEARNRIALESPTVLSQCIFADHNRQLLNDFCPEKTASE